MSSPRNKLSAAERERLRIAAAYADIAAQPAGQTVLEDLMRTGGILSTSHEPGDPHATSFNEGRRSLVLHVLDRLRWSPGQIIELAHQRTAASLADETGED